MSEKMKISVQLLMQSSIEFWGEIFIQIGDGRVVKLTNQDPDFHEVLHRYASRGLEDVYVSKADFQLFIRGIKERSLANKLFDPQTVNYEDKMKQLNGCYNLLREQFTKLGVCEEAIELAKEVSVEVMALVGENPNLFKLLTQFKNKCNQAFLDSLFTSYITCAMIDQFPWKSTAIKEKTSLASIMCDILLDPEDLIEMKKEVTPDKLSEKIFKHPDDTVALLSRKSNIIARETLSIIEQHHERPEGKGYPRGLKHQSISPLSAIYIVASDFVELMNKNQFDYSKRDEILEILSERFKQGAYQKAFIALSELLNPS